MAREYKVLKTIAPGVELREATFEAGEKELPFPYTALTDACSAWLKPPPGLNLADVIAAYNYGSDLIGRQAEKKRLGIKAEGREVEPILYINKGKDNEQSIHFVTGEVRDRNGKVVRQSPVSARLKFLNSLRDTAEFKGATLPVTAAACWAAMVEAGLAVEKDNRLVTK